MNKPTAARVRPRGHAPAFWSVPRAWEGETIFIVGGGPSVLEYDIALLRGRKVIAVNTSYERVPFAQYLIFGDQRWWTAHHNNLRDFAGEIVTPCEVHDPRVRRLRNCKPLNNEGRKVPAAPLPLSTQANAVPLRRTTFTPALNLGFLLGGSRLVLLGADGKHGRDGRRNHHSPHPLSWKHREGCWDRQAIELALFAPQLQAHGVEVLNASPGSAFDMWPLVDLSDVLASMQDRAA